MASSPMLIRTFVTIFATGLTDLFQPPCLELVEASPELTMLVNYHQLSSLLHLHFRQHHAFILTILSLCSALHGRRHRRKSLPSLHLPAFILQWGDRRTFAIP